MQALISEVKRSTSFLACKLLTRVRRLRVDL